MKFVNLFALILLLGLSTGVRAAEFIEVTKSLDINAGIDAVWNKVGDFCAIQDWHPAVAKCEAYDDHGTRYRTLTLADGGVISEKYAGTEGTSYTYFIKKSPLPVKTCKATFKAEGGTDKTTITWTARFKAKEVTEEEAKAAVAGIFDAGLTSISEKF